MNAAVAKIGNAAGKGAEKALNAAGLAMVDLGGKGAGNLGTKLLTGGAEKIGAAVGRSTANITGDLILDTTLDTMPNAAGDVADGLGGKIQSKLDDLLNSDYDKYDPGYDCPEIAEDFYNAAENQGHIYRIEGKNGIINGYEYNDILEFDYHEVYTDGINIYDPRFKNIPIPKDDYFRALKEINPDGFDVFTIK